MTSPDGYQFTLPDLFFRKHPKAMYIDVLSSKVKSCQTMHKTMEIGKALARA